MAAVAGPPVTTVASGRCTSAPALVETAIGRKPRLAAVAVVSTGRSRSIAASRAAARASLPCRRCSTMVLTSTTPFSTAMPNSAMMPPVAAKGRLMKISPASRTLPNMT